MKRYPYAVTLFLLAGSLILSVALGAINIPLRQLAAILMTELAGMNIPPTWPESFVSIVVQIRLPHTLLVAMSGAALAGSGAAFQGLFRNPLADPYLIGVASGAGLGAVFVMAVRWPRDLVGFYVVPAGAFVGALLTILLVYNLARVGRLLPLTMLILAGVAIGAFTSSMTSYMMLRSDDQLFRAITFLLGGSPLSGWRPVVASIPYITIGLVALLLSGHVLNVLQFGEEEARQLGLAVESAKFFIILTASLTTAVAVSFSGVIGFIGLIVPHAMRILWGSDYRRLIPLSILGGASALLLADLLARIIHAPQTLPVGIVTALAGAPFFLWILRRAKTAVYW